MSLVYIDASAGLKLIVHERESAALGSWLGTHPGWTSSALFRTEVLRATRRTEADRVGLSRELLARVSLLDVDGALLERAAELAPASLRSSDAIHLATALRLADELEAIVTYDRRMIDGARLLGLPVASPA